MQINSHVLKSILNNKDITMKAFCVFVSLKIQYTNNSCINIILLYNILL